MLIPAQPIRPVSGITDEQRMLMCAFLQGAIYCWSKNCPGKWFSLRDLIGGENIIWDRTPLEFLFQRCQDATKDPYRTANLDAGRLLRLVMHVDRRTFETKKLNSLCYFRWTGDEDFVG